MNNPNSPVEATINQTQPATLSTSPNNPKKILSIIGVIVLIFLVGAYYLGSKTQNKPISSKEADKVTIPQVNPSSMLPGNNATTKIVFEKQLGTNIDHTVNSEIWIMNTDGSNATKLNVPQTNPVPLNNISSGWVYYTTPQNSSNSWTIYAYNYATNQNKQITEVSQVNTAVNVSNYVVSPDSRKILYYVSYNQLVNGSPQCGQQPCPDADLYPNHKSGTYAYDIETDKKVYLGSIPSITSWDNAGNVYTTQGGNYHEFKLADGFYQVNTDTGEATLIDSRVPSNDFTYYEYPVANGEMIIIDNLKNQYGGSSQNGDVKILKNGQQTVVDSSGNICNFSTCLTISPDKKYALYIKDDSNNIASSVILLDLTTLTVKPILQAQTGQSFNLPTWVSNSQFVTEVAEGNYPNEKHDISLVDINTGISRVLTTSGNARMY